MFTTVNTYVCKRICIDCEQDSVDLGAVAQILPLYGLEIELLEIKSSSPVFKSQKRFEGN